MRAAQYRSNLARSRTAALKLSIAVLVLAVFMPVETRAQVTQSAPQTQGAQTQPGAFKSEELDALLAPVALYPDTLLAQICMASTYPLEIVQAGRWQKDNASLKGDQLNAALDMQPWDASVKGLVQVPTVLQQMNDKLDWTQKLGDAFLAQQSDVMASIQRLRERAQESGELKSTPQQVVMSSGAVTSQTIIIEQSNPEVIYVPSYNPAVVYGTWPYPAYPPYPYYPAGYAFGTGLAFGAGLAIGGAIWNNNWNWGGGNLQVNSFRNTNINNNFNRNNVNNISNRQNWNHDVNHRQGVGYRDQATGQKFGRGDAAGASARQNFRGQAGSGQFGQGGQGARAGQLGQGGAGQLGQGGRGQVGQGGAGQFGQGGRGAGGGQFGQGGSGQFGGRSAGAGGGQFGQGNIGNRASFEQRGGGNGFSGVGNGAQSRSHAQRGASSRASGARSGGARAGGGGSRGGGGRGGGGGGRR